MFERLLRRSRYSRNPLTVDARFRPARDVFMAERDGVAVLLDLRHAVYLGLDEVGTVAWREIENGASVATVTQRICSEYDAPIETVRADMQEFMTDLRRRRLVVNA